MSKKRQIITDWERPPAVRNPKVDPSAFWDLRTMAFLHTRLCQSLLFDNTTKQQLRELIYELRRRMKFIPIVPQGIARWDKYMLCSHITNLLKFYDS
jgi:hypothetical protein